ncbi:MAG: lipopolysaccharide heptosyltransferase II [Candidatus Omnitrophica bacterium]|nr:lipopolysaccharide heptosyltransferase II [Candidatus Omnitrophota bacterium]
MKRILIVNVNWLGDVLFSTPFIRAIRRHYPDAFISCMAVPRCKEILEGNPNLDELIIFDEEGKHSSLFGKLQLASFLRSKKFDEAYLLHRSLTRTLITALAKIPKRIGYETKKRKLFLTHNIELPGDLMHRAEYFLNIARQAGIAVDECGYDFSIPKEDEEYTDNFLKIEGVPAGTPFVVLNPGANWLLKRWPPENYAKLGDFISEKFRYKVIITGAQKDLKLAQDISAFMKNPSVIACGKITLKQLGVLFKRARLVVTNDTGPLHIAIAVGARVISLFGPTSSRITGPYGPGKYSVLQKDIGCIVPCYHIKCKDNRCMKAIIPDEVIKEMKRLLEKEGL